MDLNEKSVFSIGLLVFLCLMLPGSLRADTLNFDPIATGASPYFVNISSTNYLAQFGITLANVTPGTTVAALCGQCGGNTVVGSSAPNVLVQFGNNSGESFTLDFAFPLSTLGFDLAGNSKSGGSGTLVSAWSVTAYNAGHVAIGSVGDPFLFGTFSAFAPQHFTLTGPGIASITVFSNCFNVCGTQASFDNLSSPDLHQTPEPASMVLFGSGLLGAAGAVRRKLLG